MLGALCALLLLPTYAHAHGHLVRARPGPGDTIRVAPRTLRLQFSEAPELAMSSIRLVDVQGRDIRLLPLRIDADSARVLIADIPELLAPGRYTVRWQMAGRDGHPMHGQYDFVLAADTARAVGPAVPSPIATTPAPAPIVRDSLPAQTHLAEGFDSESSTYVIVRWVHFIGLLVVIGGVAFYWLVLGRVHQADLTDSVMQESAVRARSVALMGAFLLAVATIARLFAQWAALRANADDPAAMSLHVMVLGSGWGHAWLLEVGALTVAIVGLSVARRSAGARSGWAIAALGAIGLACAAALSGHAAVPQTTLPLATDVVHVLAAGCWMGALLVLLVAGLPPARAATAPARAMAALVNAFSSTALASAAVVVLSGVVAAWHNVGSVSALGGSSYGRVLLIKLAVLAVAALIGLYNWRRARPALAASGDDAAIRRAMRAELTAAAVILLVTAVLVAIPTPVELR